MKIGNYMPETKSNPNNKTVNKKPTDAKAKAHTNPTKSQKNIDPETKCTTKRSSHLHLVGIVISTILGLTSLIFLGTFISLNLLPTHYLIIVAIIILLICLGFSFLNCRTQTKTVIRIPIFILSLVFSLLNLLATSYLIKTSDFLNQLSGQSYLTEKYYVIVEKDSTYQNLADLKDKEIATFDEHVPIYQEALDQLKSSVDVNINEVKSIGDLSTMLSNHTSDAIFLSAVHKDVIEDSDASFADSTRIIHTIEIQVEAKTDAGQPNINVSTEPFTILISGSDAYGNISDRSRSDVNMLAVVNPKTHTVLLVSIPRDYYVQLHGTTGLRDKLTHAGIYGVQMSADTISDLLNVDVDYYVKVNFSTVVNLVDTIGGIEVYSDQKFVPWTNRNITIPEGNVHMDGATALAFARERKSYATGDRHRVQNQQDVLKAIIDKISHSTVILTKYSDILSDISNCLETNFGKDEISGLIRLQLQDMPNWQIYNYSLDGSDAREYTYSMGQQSLYVMMPDQKTIEAAQGYIKAVLDGEPVNL